MKKQIKSLIGQSNWNKVVASSKYTKCAFFFLKSGKSKGCLADNWAAKVYCVDKGHTFFGYYDIPQLNKSEDMILAHVVGKHAITRRDSAQIGFFRLDEGIFHPIATTRAWCWQQGSRLRWHPKEENYVVFNDVEDNQYVTRVVNLNNGKLAHTVPMALYDFDLTFSYGLSLNFSRLQRLRPGYGYDALPDQTINHKASDNDGIYYVDLKSDRRHLLLSIHDLSMENDPNLKYQHYINHISISPDGSRFIFFHIYSCPDGKWVTRLCVYDLTKGSTQILEDRDNVSHYDWRNNTEILVTCITPEKKQYYALYQVTDGKKVIIESPDLSRDGHPSFCKGGRQFITDTYPLQNCIQHLFLYDIERNERNEIASYYSSPLLYGEQRCDMHPRLSDSQKIITFDSTYSENRRKIILLQRKEK